MDVLKAILPDNAVDVLGGILPHEPLRILQRILDLWHVMSKEETAKGNVDVLEDIVPDDLCNQLETGTLRIQVE